MNGPETIYAWRYTGSNHQGQWNRSKLSHAEAEYIRADIADARVAAAYEACGQMFQKRGDDGLGAPYRALDRCRALTPADAKAALEAVRREARKEVLSANDLYYLRAVQRRLNEFRDALDGLEGLSIGGEAFADERDWLDCFIDAKTALIDKETTE